MSTRHTKTQSLATTQPDIIRPYGDTTGDGMVQVSFTLPIPHDKRAEGAALQLAAKMGLAPALLVHAKAMGPDFTFFVVYGSATHLVDLREVEAKILLIHSIRSFRLAWLRLGATSVMK